MKIGRNDPCPCGSGKKYKQCCLANANASAAAPAPVHARALNKAFAWIEQRFRAQLAGEREEYFAEFDDPSELTEALEALDPGLISMLNMNLHDWLLCEALIERRDRMAPAIEHALDARELKLLPDERAWLEALAEAPLTLYEITAIEREKGLWMRALAHADAEPAFVHEVAMTRSVEVGDVIGTRVMSPDGERLTVSGAVYPLDRMLALDVLRETDELLAAELEEGAEGDDDALADLDEWQRESILADRIRAHWLGALLRPAVPKIVSGAGGEPMILIEDDYELLDATALAAALGACADVTGDAEHGWARLAAPDAESNSVLTAVNLGKKPGTVTLFHRSRAAAERGREWFRTTAGACVRHRTRRETDPSKIFAEARALSRTDRPPEPVEPATPAEQEAILAAMRHAYAGWCDAPIPVLGNVAPRALMATREGRDRVRFLLQSYELNEKREAPAQGRPPFSFEFLWAELRLSRDEPRAE